MKDLSQDDRDHLNISFELNDPELVGKQFDEDADECDLYGVIAFVTGDEIVVFVDDFTFDYEDDPNGIQIAVCYTASGERHYVAYDDLFYANDIQVAQFRKDSAAAAES